MGKVLGVNRDKHQQQNRGKLVPKPWQKSSGPSSDYLCQSKKIVLKKYIYEKD